MLAPFEAARIKIERAERHLQELATEIDGYFKRDAAYVVYEIAEEYGGATGAVLGAFTYREREPVPSAWAAIVGDIIHNLRASLDLMASDVHRVGGGNPNHIGDVHYPFCKDKFDLRDVLKRRRLSRVDQEFLDIFEQTAPYKGGNNGLRAIHDLDILDKHQALVPTISIVELDWPVQINDGPQKFATSVENDGQRLMIFPSTYEKLPHGTRINADFSIVFRNVGTFDGAYVTKQLRACLESIELIRTLFVSAANAVALRRVTSP